MDAAQERMARLRRQGRIFRWVGAVLEGCIGLVAVLFIGWVVGPDGSLADVREVLAGWDWLLLLGLPLLEPALTLSFLGAGFLDLSPLGFLAFTIAVFATWGWVLFGVAHWVAIHVLDLDRALPHARRRWGARIRRWRGRGGD